MSLERNKQTVRRIFEDYVKRGRAALLSELFAEDYIGAQSGASRTGREAFASSLAALREGFPDIRYSIAELNGDGDLVTVHWQWQETIAVYFEDRRECFQPPANRSRRTESRFVRVENSRVTRGWVITDRLGCLQQIGVPDKTA